MWGSQVISQPFPHSQRGPGDPPGSAAWGQLRLASQTLPFPGWPDPDLLRSALSRWRSSLMRVAARRARQSHKPYTSTVGSCLPGTSTAVGVPVNTPVLGLTRQLRQL